MSAMKMLASMWVAACLFALAGIASAQGQAPSTGQSMTPNPELVGMLTRELKITPQQAMGGAGAIFGLAKSRLNPADFSKMAAFVPGMDIFLKAAPPAQGGGAGGLASLAGSFESLRLSPAMAGNFVPVLENYIASKGGSSVAGVFAGALGQAPSTGQSTTPNPELVGKLTKELKVTPEQAMGGAGAIFGLAKSQLNPADFSKLAAFVPGMEGLLKAAPTAKGGLLDSLGSIAPGGAGGLASVAGSFESLGLSPAMAGKFVPVLKNYIESKGGSNIAGLFAGALK